MALILSRIPGKYLPFSFYAPALTSSSYINSSFHVLYFLNCLLVCRPFTAMSSLACLFFPTTYYRTVRLPWSFLRPSISNSFATLTGFSLARLTVCNKDFMFSELYFFYTVYGGDNLKSQQWERLWHSLLDILGVSYVILT